MLSSKSYNPCDALVDDHTTDQDNLQGYLSIHISSLVVS